MVVYLDLVIISTIITDYAILKLIAEIWKEKIKLHRLIFALVISVLNIFLYIFPFKHLMLLRYFSGVIIPIICFKHNTIKDTIIKIVTYYILNIFYIGTIIIFNITSYFLLFLSLAFVCACYIVQNYKNITINDNSYIYKVTINNKAFKAYLDTGNMMYYDGIPIVLIKSKLFNNNMYTYISKMKVSSVGNDSIIDIYRGPLLTIDKIEYVVYYTFNNNIDYDIILHKDCR